MKIGYSTLAFAHVPLEDAIAGMAEIGYEALEVAVTREGPAALKDFTAARRKKIRAAARKARLGSPAVACYTEAADGALAGKAFAAYFKDVCDLALELQPGKSRPIVAWSPLAAAEPVLPADAQAARAVVEVLAATAKHCGVTLVVKPLPLPPLDTVAGFSDLVTGADGNHVRANLDLSAFVANGLEPDDCVPELCRLTAYAHAKDVTVLDGRIVPLLPGDGDFDYPGFMVALDAHKYKGTVCVELGEEVRTSESYDPWGVAEYCFDIMREAREVAEIGWGEF